MYVKGSQIVPADTLSCNLDKNQTAHNEEMDALWKAIEEVSTLEHIEIQDELLQHINQETKQDIGIGLRETVFSVSRRTCDARWCDSARGKNTGSEAKPNKRFKSATLQSSGGESYIEKTRLVVYWANMNDHIRNYVKKCEACIKLKACQTSEPMQSIGISVFPYDIVVMDLEEVSHVDKKFSISITVDHFSNYFDVDVINNQATKSLIDCSKRNLVVLEFRV